MIDVVVTPGLGFDTHGGRVGFGGGHYDRLLGRCGADCTRIGVAFEWQLRRRVPVEAHDAVLHWIVTEQRAVSCG